jgi:hypothetical protein
MGCAVDRFMTLPCVQWITATSCTLNIASLEMVLLILVDSLTLNLGSKKQDAAGVHNTRDHCLKLLGQQCQVNTRKFFFTERVVEPWNSLPATALDFSSLSKFKMFLKKVDFNKFLLNT